MQMELNTLFTQAVAASKDLSEKPSNESLLQLYSFYKQATLGDANGEAPNMFDFVAKAKYEAWASLKGRTKEEAMNEYINLVEKLKS
jgi:diazepam-binding inhibitor (GABA receptor modulator, acyl-CoA-binding protein)